MGSAFEWIGYIAEWLGRFIPRWVILDMTEGAVKYRRGDEVTVCNAGIHFYWPVVSTFQQYPVARQTDRLPAQTMMTSDGVTFLVSGTLTYVVEDLGKLLPVVHSPATHVVDTAMAAIHDVCCEMSWDQLREEQGHATKLKTKLRVSAQAQLAEYGVRVVKLQLNTLAKCRVIKLSQSTSNEEN